MEIAAIAIWKICIGERNPTANPRTMKQKITTFKIMHLSADFVIEVERCVLETEKTIDGID